MKKWFRAFLCTLPVWCAASPAMAAPPTYASAYDAYHAILTRVTERLGRADYLAQPFDDDIGYLEVWTQKEDAEKVLMAVGCTFRDMNGDGTEELLIGRLNDETGERYSGEADTLLGVYTYRNGRAEQILSGTARNAYMPLNDGTLWHYGSSGAVWVRSGQYNVSPAGGLECLRLYFTAPDKENPATLHYYSNVTGTEDVTQSTEVTAEAFDRFSDGCAAARTTIPMHTLLDYRDGILAARPIKVSCSILPRAEVSAAPDAEEIIDANGMPVVLSNNEPMYNFRLMRVRYEEGEFPLRISQQVFHADDVRSVGLTLRFDGAIPNYAVCYETADGEQYYSTINQSGEDGHLYLMPL